MKRIICAILTATMIFALTAAAFAENNLDLTVIESSNLYKYDRFDNTWSVKGQYTCTFQDGSYVKILCALFDDYIENEQGPEFRITSYDAETDDFEIIDSFQALVDGVLFKIEDLKDEDKYSNTFDNEDSRAFLNSLSSAKDVAFKIFVTGKHDSYSLIIDPVKLDALQDLIEIAEVLELSNAWGDNPAKGGGDNNSNSNADSSGKTSSYTSKKYSDVDDLPSTYRDSDIPLMVKDWLAYPLKNEAFYAKEPEATIKVGEKTRVTLFHTGNYEGGDIHYKWYGDGEVEMDWSDGGSGWVGHSWSAYFTATEPCIIFVSGTNSNGITAHMVIYAK